MRFKNKFNIEFMAQIFLLKSGGKLECKSYNPCIRNEPIE